MPRRSITRFTSAGKYKRDTRRAVTSFALDTRVRRYIHVLRNICAHDICFRKSHRKIIGVNKVYEQYTCVDVEIRWSEIFSSDEIKNRNINKNLKKKKNTLITKLRRELRCDISNSDK